MAADREGCKDDALIIQNLFDAWKLSEKTAFVDIYASSLFVLCCKTPFCGSCDGNEERKDDFKLCLT